MNSKIKFYGPTFPNEIEKSEISDTNINEIICDELKIEQYQQEKAECEIIGPLLPGNQVLEEVRHIRTDTPDNSKHLKNTENEWMYKLMPPSEPDPIKSLKARKFLMGTNYLSVPDSSQIASRCDKESLMEIHLKDLEKQNKKKTRKRSSSIDSDKVKNRKSKRSKKKRKRNSSTDSDKVKKKKSKKKKSDDVKLDVPMKWSPFNAKSSRKPFDRDTDLLSKGVISKSARAEVMKQAHGMYGTFMMESKK